MKFAERIYDGQTFVGINKHIYYNFLRSSQHITQNVTLFGLLHKSLTEISPQCWVVDSFCCPNVAFLQNCKLILFIVAKGIHVDFYSLSCQSHLAFQLSNRKLYVHADASAATN